MKRPDVDRDDTRLRDDRAVGEDPTLATTPQPRAEESHVTVGRELWTMTKGEAVVRARCWQTRRGPELEVQIWTGPLIEGREDLSWSQVFGDDEAAVAAADQRKRKMQRAGWQDTVQRSHELTPVE